MTLEEESIMKKIAVLTLAPVLALAAVAAFPALAQTGSSSYGQGTMETAPGTVAPGGMMTPNRQMQPGTQTMQPGTHMQPGAMSGQTQQRHMAPMAGSSSGTHLSVEQGRPDISDRKGKEQREMELVQTSLLNRFGGMGFAEMRNFRKIGENYAAEVRTVEGVWVNILIDPATGNVTVQQ
jgi:hypothetical protein